MGLDNLVRVIYERRANIWIISFLLIYTKIDPTLAAPPDLDSELTVEAITTTGARVRWARTLAGHQPTFDNYEVSISPSAGIYFQPGPLLTATTTNPETTVSGLAAGVEYTVSVRTVNGTDKGTPKTITFTAKPNPLSGNSAIRFTNVASTTTTVSWSAPSGTFAEYVISVSPAGATLSPSSPVGAGTTSTSLTSLTPGTTYTAEVRTKSGESLSDGVTYSLTTIPAPVTRVEPIIPGHDSVHMTIHKPAGTISSVEISCSGPSNGALNGCTFPKSGFFNGNTYNVTYYKVDSDEDYTFTIKAVSNTKKSAPKVVTVRTTEGRSGRPSLFTASAQSPTSVKLEWKTPISPNGLITSYVTEYTGTYKAHPFLNLPADNGKVAFINIDLNAGSYVRTIVGLKGGYQYDFVLYGKTTYQGPGENAATSVTMPTAAPTLSADAVAPQGTGEADKTTITAIFSKAFNESNGPILYYSVIVAENRNGAALSTASIPDDTVSTWKQCARLLIRLRGYTGKNKYSDTDYSQRMPTGSPNAVHEQAITIGVSVTAVVILVIAIVVPVVVIVKRRKQQKGAENKQRPQAEVTVENSAFADIYDELIEPPQAPVKETAVMSMVTRYLPSADSEAREKLQAIFARLGVEGVSDLTYVKESDVVPPLTVIQARMFIEKVQEQEMKGSFDDVIHQEATVHPDQASTAVYVNVGDGLAVSGESAKGQTSKYASLQGYVKPDQNTYDQLSGVLRK